MRTILIAFTAFCVCASSSAQEYPTRPVHLIVPYTPGTGADILARLVGPKLGERWKIGVVTENKPGATGNIGTEFVAKAPPDGHTLLFVATSFGTTPALQKNLPFDPVKSFEPVALIATSGLVFITNPQVPARTMKDFIELAKRQPGKMHYSSPGNGGPQHLAMELIKLETGMDIVHVPYKGAAPAVNDLLGGQVQMGIFDVPVLLGHIRSGKLKALAVTSAQRAPALAEVPTTAEAKLPNVTSDNWYGLIVPAATPAEVQKRVHAAAVAALKSPAVAEQYAKVGGLASPGTPQEYAAFLAKEQAKWRSVVNAIGFKEQN
jgi:tripartite-type tricarboxylate transporter receptor subunit TctC